MGLLGEVGGRYNRGFLSSQLECIWQIAEGSFKEDRHG